QQLKTDRNGVLWVLTRSGTVHYVRPGSRTFERIDTGARKIEVAELTSGPDGSMYLFSLDDAGVTTLRTLRHNSSAAVAHWDKGIRPSGSYATTLFDRDGNFWMADTVGARRFRLPGNSVDDVVALSGRHPFQMLEDREGNIWIATSDGLDRFRTPALVK